MGPPLRRIRLSFERQSYLQSKGTYLKVAQRATKAASINVSISSGLTSHGGGCEPCTREERKTWGSPGSGFGLSEAGTFSALLVKPSCPHGVRTDSTKVYQLFWGTSVATIVV